MTGKNFVAAQGGGGDKCFAPMRVHLYARAVHDV